MPNHVRHDKDEFRELYDSAPCGFLSTNSVGLITRMNQTFLELIGYDAEEVIAQKTLQDLLTIGGKLYYETHYRPLLVHQKEAREISFYLKAKDGTRIPVLVNTKSIINESGEEVFISTILDTSHRKSYEKELLVAKEQAERLTAELGQANEELKRFAHVVTHDIKTPISNIVMMFEFLEQNFSMFNEEQIRDYMGRIKDASFRLSDMVSRILAYYTNSDLSKVEPDDLEMEGLFKKILDICDPEGLIHSTLTGGCKKMRTYSVVVELILLNLIVNALKYNDKEVVEIELNVEENEGYYLLNVKDNGQGIRKEHLNTIFEPLKTLGVKDRFQQQGTGLGLSYVKKMVNKLGGKIGVESELGVGSTFSFTIKKLPADL